MNWKEFLKPNLGKIIIFFIILLIWSFIPLIPVFIQIMCHVKIGGTCPIQLEFSNLIYFITNFSKIFKIYLSLIAIIIEIFSIYIISCLFCSLNKIIKKTKRSVLK